MPKKEVDMVSPLVLEEHLNDVADDFYFDLPMEDLEGNQLTEVDWDASLQHLELPSDDLIGGLSTPFTVKIFDDNSLCHTSSSQEESKPKVQDFSQGSTETAAHRKIYHHVACEGGKDPTLFPNSSSVSVLESSNKLLLGYRFFIPVKRARSKRLRPPTLNPRLTIPFISSSDRRKVRKRNPPPDGTDTDEPQLSPGVTRKCTHCEVTKTPQWREGPMGPKTLCNACGVRYRSGRLLPEYRPAASPTFVASVHSNLHRKVVEMRNKGGSGQVPRRATTAVDSSSSLRPPQLGNNNSNGCHRLSV